MAGGLVSAAGEPVAINPQSGLTISGFDPVAYFTDASAKEGRPGVEYTREGVTWRFQNEGNRAAFADRPDIYGPRFGGYDPVAIARGASVSGHPMFGQRLYLFYSAKARAMFAAEPEQVIAAAERKWPAAQRTLP
jgi:YHS domain-containing protein